MKDNWIPIDDKAKELGICLLLCYDKRFGFRIVRGSYRYDDNIQDEKLWLRNDYDDWSIGYASTPISNIVAYQPLPYVDESKWKPKTR